MVQRIPKVIIEHTYGLSIRSRRDEETILERAIAEDLLTAYAGEWLLLLRPSLSNVKQVARGFARAGQGNPDEARAARYILKDYVNAKLLYCHPPPDVSDEAYNRDAHLKVLQKLAKKKRAPMSRVAKNADTYIDFGQTVPSSKARFIDDSFFVSGQRHLSPRPFVQGTNKHGQEFSRDKSLPHHNIVGDDGRPLEGRRARIAAVLAANGVVEGGKSKKHFKGNKRIKQRSGAGYE